MKETTSSPKTLFSWSSISKYFNFLHLPSKLPNSGKLSSFFRLDFKFKEKFSSFSKEIIKLNKEIKLLKFTLVTL